MAEIKKISTELQLLDKFLDTSGGAGTSGQVLSSTATGISWINGSSIIGGPYLPLSAGSSYPLTGNLFIRGDDKGLVVQNAASTTNVTVGAVSSSAVSTGLITLRHLGVTKIVLNANDNSYFNNGNVGIGTTSPNNILELSKQVSSGIGPILQLTNSQYSLSNDSGSSIQFRGYTVWGPGSTNPRYSEINAINGSGSVPKRIEFKFYADADVKTPLSILQTGRVGIGTTSPKAKLDVNGRFCVDSKAHTLTNAFTTCLTVNLSNHTGCHVVITVFGDWPGHSSAAYRGEFFLQNGANSYAEPGIILRQDDNTSVGTDQIICQIVDPTSTANPKDFQIQIRHTDTTSPASWTGQLTYTVQGQFNSIT